MTSSGRPTLSLGLGCQNSMAIALGPAPPGAGLDVLLEQVAAAACSTANRPYLLGVSGHRVVVWRPDCHQWKCPHCGRVLANRLVHTIAYGVHVYKEAYPSEVWSFVTLTARGDRRGMTHSLEDFRKAWPKLRKRLGRAVSHKLHYAAVPERHNDDAGTVHMHILMNVRLEDAKQYLKRDGSKVWRSRSLARMATACGLGWSHDVQPLDSEGMAAAYVAKYAAKHTGDADWPKSMMHYRTSQHWPRHDDGVGRESALDWRVVPAEHLYAVLSLYVKAGYTLDGSHG